MDVLVADLDEDGSRLGEQLARSHQPVAKVRQVRVDTQLPGVPVRAHLLGLPREVRVLAVADIALPRD